MAGSAYPVLSTAGGERARENLAAERNYTGKLCYLF
jgi:hypothetical protein